MAIRELLSLFPGGNHKVEVSHVGTCSLLLTRIGIDRIPVSATAKVLLFTYFLLERVWRVLANMGAGEWNVPPQPQIPTVNPCKPFNIVIIYCYDEFTACFGSHVLVPRQMMPIISASMQNVRLDE